MLGRTCPAAPLIFLPGVGCQSSHPPVTETTFGICTCYRKKQYMQYSWAVNLCHSGYASTKVGNSFKYCEERILSITLLPAYLNIK